MRFQIESKRRKEEMIRRLYPNARIIDVTSKGPSPWQKFSPFYPHGNIPVPFSKHIVSFSVEGIWQGLKVFENEDVDTTKFEVTNMKGIKRTIRKHGAVLGHREGVSESNLLGYVEARKAIYLPTYIWVLQNKLFTECNKLIQMAHHTPLVFLDYEINVDFDDPSRPLSHASLLIQHLRKFFD